MPSSGDIGIVLAQNGLIILPDAEGSQDRDLIARMVDHLGDRGLVAIGADAQIGRQGFASGAAFWKKAEALTVRFNAFHEITRSRVA